MQILIQSKLNSKTDDTVSKVAEVISLAISYVLFQSQLQLLNSAPSMYVLNERKDERKDNNSQSSTANQYQPFG